MDNAQVVAAQVKVTEAVAAFFSSFTPQTAVMTALLVFGALISLVVFWAIMRSDKNQISCWQFLSTRAKDGKHYGDLDKLGKFVGIFVSSWAVLALAFKATNNDFSSFAILLTAYLAFVGGIAGYSAWLRTKQTYTPPQEEKP